MFKLLAIRKKSFLKLMAIALMLALTLAGVMRFYLLPAPIFAFHSIFDRNHPDELPSRASYLDYSLQNLEELLTYLVKNDYWFLSSQELDDYFIKKNRRIPEEYRKTKPVILTFDDGYKNIDAYVLPLLQKLQKTYNKPLKIVLFINPRPMKSDDSQKKVAGTPPCKGAACGDRPAAVKYLKCEDLKRGTELGFYDVQSHGYSHADLTRMLPQKLEYELAESQRALKNCLADWSGRETVAQSLAYPYNKVNKNVEEVTSNYYRSAYLFNSRWRHLLFLRSPYKIPRIGISKNDSPDTLIQLTRRYSK
jgi:peptidoglycan/xylan/chitin deacetylase (PgdA/CDA1 family)